MATVIAYKVFDGTNWVELALKNQLEASFNDATNNFSEYSGMLVKRKVYTGVIGGANITGKTNTWANRSMYFITVKPISWNATWRIKYHFNIHLDDENQQYKSSASAGVVYPGKLCRSTHYCSISGGQGIYRAYSSFNTIQDTSYRTCYYTMIHETTEAGFNAGRGHKIGISLTDSFQPVPVTDYSSGSAVANTKYSRTIEVIIDEAVNCEAIIEDYIEVEADSVLVGTSYGDNPYISLESTYYPTNTSGSNSAGRWVYIANVYAQGLQETGDDNTIDVLQLSAAYLKNGSKYNNSGTLTGMKCLSYALLGFDKDGNALVLSTYSASQTTRTTSISAKGTRIYEAVGFDYTKGLIYQNSSSYADYDANMDISPRKFGMAIDLRYSDNCVANANATTLGMVPRKPVYLRGVLGEDGLFYLRPIDVTYNGSTYQRVWTQDIPTTEDGYMYWFIGYPYYNASYINSQYQLDLFASTQLMHYKDGAFREYVTPTQIQSDWNQTNTSALDYIKNKPNSLTPTAHASSASTYGVGTTTEYGHVRVLTGDCTNASYVAGYAASTNHNHDGTYLKTAVTKLGTRTGDITIANLKSDLGLGTAAYVNTGTGSGNIPVLDSNGKLSTSVLPALAITDTFVCSSQAAMLALTAEVGDVCVRTDLNKSYILKTDGASTLSHWQELLTPTDAVQSVNGHTGTVVLTAADVSAVRYDINNQGLSTTQKSNARTNIGAGTGNGNVTGSSLSSGYIVVGNSGSAIKNSGYMPATSATSWNDSSEIYIPTMAAIAAYVSGATSGKFVRYDIGSQGLSANQQAQARANIGAGQVDGGGLTADCFIVGFDGTSKVQTTTYKPASSSVIWDDTSNVYIPTMAAIASYLSSGYVDRTSSQTISGEKIFSDGSLLVNKTISTLTSNANYGATGIEVSVTRVGPGGGSLNQGTLSFPTFLTQGGTETFATQEWVQSQGGGGGNKYLHTITLSMGDGYSSYYCFTFTILNDVSTPMDDIETIYNYLLDETDNLEVHGSGIFWNLTYAGTSTADKTYRANKLLIDGNDTLFLEGFEVPTSSLYQVGIVAQGFVCYGSNNDFWGFGGRIIDEITGG